MHLSTPLLLPWFQLHPKANYSAGVKRDGVQKLADNENRPPSYLIVEMGLVVGTEEDSEDPSTCVVYLLKYQLSPTAGMSSIRDPPAKIIRIVVLATCYVVGWLGKHPWEWSFWARIGSMTWQWFIPSTLSQVAETDRVLPFVYHRGKRLKQFISFSFFFVSRILTLQ